MVTHDKRSIQVTNPYSTDMNHGCPDGIPTSCLANGGLSVTVDGENNAGLLHPTRYCQPYREECVSYAYAPLTSFSARQHHGSQQSPVEIGIGLLYCVHPLHQSDFSHRSVSDSDVTHQSPSLPAPACTLYSLFGPGARSYLAASKCPRTTSRYNAGSSAGTRSGPATTKPFWRGANYVPSPSKIGF